jgi:hypothetical protein
MKNNCLFLISCLFLMSCSKRVSDNSTEVEDFADGLPHEKVCELSNSPILLGELDSFHFADEESFIVSTVQPPVVVLFNKEGEQLRSIGSRGRGQFEYLTPSLVRSYNGLIYVWCSNLLKLMVFTKLGEAVKEYHFTRAIKDFAVNNEIVFFYNKSGFDDSRIISTYNLEAEEFLPHAYGFRTNEHDILESSFCTGAMLIDDEHLYFAPSDRTKFYKIDLTDFSMSEIAVDAPDFETEIVKQPLEEFMEDVFTSVKYIFGSDVITGLYKASGKIVLMAETGEIEMQGLDITDYSGRRILFYVVDNDNQLSRAFRTVPLTGTSSCLYASVGGKVYMLRLADDLQNWSLFALDAF